MGQEKRKHEARRLTTKGLEGDYPRNIQIALSVSLLSFILIFNTIKGLLIAPYSGARAENITIVEEMAALEDITIPPPPVQRPQVQVEVAEPGETADQTDSLGEIVTLEFTSADIIPPRVDSIYEVYLVEVVPEITEFVSPAYPEAAKQAGIEGRVVVQVVVDERGKIVPGTERILASTNDIFNEPALEAARSCTFKPGRMGDRQVKVRVNIPFSFKLR